MAMYSQAGAKAAHMPGSLIAPALVLSRIRRANLRIRLSSQLQNRAPTKRYLHVARMHYFRPIDFFAS